MFIVELFGFKLSIKCVLNNDNKIQKIRHDTEDPWSGYGSYILHIFKFIMYFP